MAVESGGCVCEGLGVLVHNPHCLNVCSQVGAACGTLPVRASLQREGCGPRCWPSEMS